jgi:hypothetical protein
MEKQTKILIGAGALAVVYYLYNASKTAPVTPTAKTPISPSGLTEVKSDEKTLEALKAQLAILQSNPNNYNSRPIGVEPQPPIKVERGGLPPEPTKKEEEEGKRLAEIKAYEEENVRQQAIIDAASKTEADRLAKIKANQEEEAMRLANQKAYEAMQAENEAAWKKENEIRQKAYLAEIEKKRLEALADEAARQKAMNDLMYKCPEGLEYFEYGCMPTSMVVEEKAKRGQGLILRDYVINTTTLVQACPSDYVKQGINCIPRNSLSPQQLQVLAMEESGMVQTSDGQWYTSAEAAAIAQAQINTYNTTQNSTQKYTPRQSNINIAICSIDRDGYINNPNSRSTHRMQLNQYIGEFKVTSAELSIARASCPNSVYSSNLVAGGRTDDNALGYKGI